MCDMWCVYVKLNRQRMGDCLDNLNIDDLHLLEQEMEQSIRRQDKGSDDEDGSDDDDEAERTRSLARQRRKQEAHLSVYRQQMQKVTGDTPITLERLS